MHISKLLIVHAITITTHVICFKHGILLQPFLHLMVFGEGKGFIKEKNSKMAFGVA
jgi:hypothetical protein